jgi:hypothetical protein
MLPNSETYLSRPATKRPEIFGVWCSFVGSSRQNYATSHALSSLLLGMRFAFLIQQDRRLSALRCPPGAELDDFLDMIVKLFSLFSRILSVTAARFSSYSSIVRD